MSAKMGKDNVPAGRQKIAKNVPAFSQAGYQKLLHQEPPLVEKLLFRCE
jgi:hypothetical protein